MPNHKRKIAKAKPLHPKRRKKKAKKGPELVDKCDHCGNDLGRTCARTTGSAVCAAGVGLAVDRLDGKLLFFCSSLCRDVVMVP
jgi:ribosomal protein L24E